MRCHAIIWAIGNTHTHTQNEPLKYRISTKDQEPWYHNEIISRNIIKIDGLVQIRRMLPSKPIASRKNPQLTAAKRDNW